MAPQASIHARLQGMPVETPVDRAFQADALPRFISVTCSPNTAPAL